MLTLARASTTFLCLLAVAPASAQSHVTGDSASDVTSDVTRARAHYVEARFDEAIAGFEAALEGASLTRADAAEAHRHLAALRVLMGETERAGAHARAAVLLDPEAQGPEGAPPEVQALLDGARGEALTIAIEANPLRAGERASVRATSSPTDAPFVAALRIVCGDLEEEGAPPSITLAIAPVGDAVRCEASARTGAGATLVTAERRFDVEAAVVLEEPAAPRDGDDGALLWGLVGGAIGLVVIGAVVLGVVLGTAPQSARFGPPVVEGWP